MISTLRRWWKQYGCDHRYEVDAQVAGTRARVRYCPVCSHIEWVD